MAPPKGNKYYKLRLSTGRKPLYETPEAMQEGIVEYFDSFEGEKEKRPTLTGLAFHLGFLDKKSLKDYAGKDDFSPIIKRAMLFVEKGYEELVQAGKTSNIFILKNMGWTDEQTVNVKDEYSNLTDDELEKEIERLQKIQDSGSKNSKRKGKTGRK
jgi:hypothetical protein